MNLYEITAQYTLRDTNDTDATLLSFYDPSDNDSIMIHWEQEAEQSTFDHDTPIEFHENGDFTVVSRDGESYTFSAFITRKVNLDSGARAINLADVKLDSEEPNRLNVKVGKFDVLLNHTDEGIVVDVWKWVENDALVLPTDPLATCYAFDSDADED